MVTDMNNRFDVRENSRRKIIQYNIVSNDNDV